MNKVSAEQIDSLLPQTQCGLCSFKGCMPYAEALAQDTAEINLCPPGGVKGLYALAALLDKDATPFVAEMEKQAKPKLVAVIREDECIGCTKCIPACPVDAIVGSAKVMHTVITADCTGCELCIAPCPVDCIDLIARDELSESLEKEKADLSRIKYRAHEARLAQEKLDRMAARQIQTKPQNEVIAERQAFIREALLRAKAKKSS